jgi:hypothetical protein
MPLLCRLAERPFLLRRKRREEQPAVPNSGLGAKEVRLWARTLTPGGGGGWIQVELGARPAQAVVLVEERDAYSEVNRRTIGISLLPSRTLWSTQGDIRRLRRSAWRGYCSQMFCLMTLRARRHFPITAGPSRTMRSIISCAFSQMEGSRGIA